MKNMDHREETTLGITVIIADDNSFVREGMRIILSTFDEFQVLATMEDGEQAVEFCKRHEVDIALLDVRMPNMNGVEATRLICERTRTKPLILTTFDDDAYIKEAIRYGARGYLLKNNDPETIRDAIKTVYHGHHVLQEEVLDKLKSGWTAPEQQEDASIRPGERIDRSLFTERELNIMALIAQGLTNKEISQHLFISEGTIANHISSILSKTGLTHRTQIAIYYLTGEIKPR